MTIFKFKMTYVFRASYSTKEKVLFALLVFAISSIFVIYKDSHSYTKGFYTSVKNLSNPTETIFNVTNFTWILNPGHSICGKKNSQAKILLILIHSARQYEISRRAIRSTYGSLKYYQGYSIRIVFFMGLYDPQRNLSYWDIAGENVKLLNEHYVYGDTVLGSFVDSYRNLTYKHAMVLTWATKFCPNASWVLKADDDMFLDLPKLIQIRKTDLTLSKPPAFYCILIYNNTEPERKGKWHPTPEEYPDKYYPEYCYGTTYGIDMDMIRKWLAVYKTVRFYFIDDVYFTGLVRREAKRVFNETWNKEVKNLWNYHTPFWGSYLKYCDKLVWDGTKDFKEIVVTRRSTTENDMTCMWRILQLMAAKVTATSNKTVSLGD